MKTNAIRFVAALLSMLSYNIAHAGTRHYYYTDPQGTVLAKADAQGNILASYDYKPYGAQALGAPPNGPGYTGHVNDPDTGLVYMQQRYYDPGLGRFLSVDPVGPTPGNAYSFNRYDYANNNPLRFTDPDGRQSVGEMIDAGAQGCGAVSCAGWAVLHAAWSMTGAEPVSQVADKGWSNVSTGDKIGAAVAVAAVLPPVKILGAIAPIAKEAVPTIEAAKRATSQIDRAAFRAERAGFWKAEGQANPSKYTAENLERMNGGRAPVGVDGKSMELHHVDGTPRGGLMPMTRTEHRLGENYLKNHQWLEKQ